ncbi:MAG: hypothetical protein Phyf2KO_25610 [Phycisphaerales bacterium]
MSEPGQSEQTSASLSERQRVDQAERVAIVENDAGKRGRRGRKRFVFGTLSVVILLLLVLLPQVVGVFGKGMIESRASDAIGADVRIERLGLSWFGSQEFGSVRLVDGSLREAADIDVRVERSLVGLVTNWKNLGRVVVGGSVTLDRTEGPLADLLKGETSQIESSDGPAQLPSGLKAELVLDGLGVRYIDDNGRDLRANSLAGTVDFAVGEDITIDLKARVSSGDGIESDFSIDAEVSGLTDTSGRITAESASASGSVQTAGDGSPIEMILLRELGIDSARLEMDFEGSVNRGTTRVLHESQGAGVDLTASYRRVDGAYSVEVERESSLQFSHEVLRAVVPGIPELAATRYELESGRVVSLGELPDAAIRVTDFRFDVPTVGGVDLNTLAADLTLETSEFTGRLDEDSWFVEPLTLGLSTRGVERGIGAQAVTTAQLDGRPAGVFVLNAEAPGLFGEAGAPPASMDEIVERLVSGLVGVIEINNVETALAESVLGPVARRAGIVLEQDLGESVDLELSLSSYAGRNARFWLTSDNLNASAGFVIEDGVLRSDDVRADAQSLVPLISRQLGADHVWLDSGGGAELWIRDLVIDLDRLNGDIGSVLSALSGVMELRIQPILGQVMDRGELMELSTDASAVTVDLSDIANGASVAAGLALRVDSRPAGSLNVSVRISGLLDDDGLLVPGLPKIDGEVTLRDALTSLAQPYVVSSGLVLREDIGPKLTLITQASVDSDDTVSVTGTVRAERLIGSAKFEIKDRVLSSVDQGLSLELLHAGEALTRVLGGGVTAPQGGGIRLNSKDLVLAGSEDGVDWSRSRVSIDVGASGVTVVDAEENQYKIDRLDAGAAFGSGSDGVFSLNAVVHRAGEPVLLAGQMTLYDLITGSRITPDSVRLGGQVDVTGFQIAAATDAVDLGGSDVRAFAAEVFGRLLDASLVADESTGGVTVSIKGDRLTGVVDAALAGGDLRIESGRFTSEISEEVIEQIQIRSAQAAGSTEPTGLRFTEPARAELTIGKVQLLSGWSFDPSGIADIGLTASGQVEGIRLARGDSIVESGAVGVGVLTAEGRLPIGGILGNEQAEASLVLSADLLSGESALGTLSGGLDVSFEGGKPSGRFRGDLSVDDVDSGLVDEVFKLDGVVAGTTGARAGADVRMSGRVDNTGLVALEGSVSLQSPRLSTESPAKVVVDESSVTLAEPVRIDWLVETDIATHLILQQPIGAERVFAAEAVDSVLEINELVLGRAGNFIRPDIFRIDASYETAVFTARVIQEEDDSETGVDYVYRDNTFRIHGDAGLLQLSGVANPADGVSEPVILDIEIRDFADVDGNFSLESASVAIDLDVQDSPTAIYDALLRQDGLMAEVLGPRLSLRAEADMLTRDTGVLTLDLDSTRARGDLVGKMFEGRFIATEPAQLVVNEVRPELGAYLSRAIPVIGTISKAPEDGPAIMTLQTLEIPMLRDSDYNRIQGLSLEATIDLGLARFETSSVFVGVVKAVQQRSEGGLGRRMEPIEITVNSGNVTYPRTKVPIGEFTIESEGRYNLITGDMDIVTFVPVGAMSEESLGELKTGLTTALGRFVPVFESATMVPWRTTGLPGNRETKPDIDMLLKNVGTQLNPLRILREEIGIPEFRFEENRRRATDEDEREGG